MQNDGTAPFFPGSSPDPKRTKSIAKERAWIMHDLVATFQPKLFRSPI
jgi:hypothetical protein